VIKLHATYSKIISKFTSNISKNTSKFTSKTNQIRLGGPRGGPYPLLEPSRGCILAPQIRGVPWVRGIHSGEARTLGVGELMTMMRTMMRTIARDIAGIGRNITGISPDLLGLYWNVARISTRGY